MADFIAFLFWYGFGFAGCLLVWRSELLFDAYLDRKYPTTRRDFKGWCPTPRAILDFAIGSFLGPLAIAAGLIGTFVTWCEIGKETAFGRWFKRPLCKRGESP